MPKKHIELAHSLGINFNYVVNASCLGNIEFDREGRKKILEYFDLINNLDVDMVTVAIPYLIELIKKEYSSIKIKASEIADVHSAIRAKFYEGIGAEILTLEIMYNRSFRVLESIRRSVNAEIELVVNSACLFQCPYHDYHNNIVAHTTQEEHPLHGYYMDYCIMKCVPTKLSNPIEIIKAPWIRPEDLHKYEKIGINRFKISNRVGKRELGLKCMEAYSNRRWDGNLGELLTPLSVDIEKPDGKRLESFPKAQWNQMTKIWNVPPPSIYVDNNALEGFIDYFTENDCYGQCGVGCNYCEEIANKAIKINKEEVSKYLNMTDQLLAPLMMIRVNREEEVIEWLQKINVLFEKLIGNIPEMFRDIATITIRKKAETNAKNRGSNVVGEEDLVRALIEETPELFRSQMIEDLKKENIYIDMS